MICAYKLQAASGLPNSNKPRTLDQRNSASMSSAPRNNDYITRSSSLSRPSQTRIGMCDVSSLIYDPNLNQNCLSYARYATSALDVKEEAQYTLLVDSAVLIN